MFDTKLGDVFMRHVSAAYSVDATDGTCKCRMPIKDLMFKATL